MQTNKKKTPKTMANFYCIPEFLLNTSAVMENFKTLSGPGAMRVKGIKAGVSESLSELMAALTRDPRDSDPE